MRLPTLILLILVLTSCYSAYWLNKNSNSHVLVNFQGFSSNSDIKGSILIYDLEQDMYYSNDFDWAKLGRIPASSFKIPHSMIALELGIVNDGSSILKWNGEDRYLKTWEQDLTFKQAFHYSCVPCYQEISRKIGNVNMKEFIKKFNFGQMDIQDNNIDDFWLIGESKISQFEQIDFLKRLYRSELPISKHTENIFKKLFITTENDNYTLRAKTGLSIQNNIYNGWYVGYIKTIDNVYIFATNISPKNKYDNSLINKRKAITIQALKELKIQL